MARRQGDIPQLDFPQLTADLITQLRIRGPIGVLDFLDQVRPVFIIGARGLEVVANTPLFTSASIFRGDAGVPAANTVIFDSGPLAAGSFDLWASIHCWGRSTTNDQISLQHRNAANTATLAVLASISTGNPVIQAASAQVPLIGYTIALNERIRLISGASLWADGRISGVLGLQLRAAP